VNASLELLAVVNHGPDEGSLPPWTDHLCRCA
jgi:hypothetical protein